jgi:peptidoglycan/xylan/chitin deacetylase (PgdA/CDA1 family)
MSRRGAPLNVLMFHGVTDELPAYAVYAGTRTCIIRASDFQRCIAWCRRTHRIVRLADVPAYLRGDANEPGVLITFDDGLASVIDLAVPVLRTYGVTAALFVTTGWIDSAATPAIFRLERDLWEQLPDTLTVCIPGGAEFAAKVATRDRVGAALAGLWAFCFQHRVAPLSLAADWVRFDQRRWQPDPAGEDRHWWFPARWDEIAGAVQDGVLEIGAHGATHTPWSWLSDEGRRREIAEPRERLQPLMGETLPACAYPHGMHDDDARAAAADSYACAFTTQGGVATGQPASALPRFHVPSERPVSMNLILRYPLAGRIVRKGLAQLRSA